MTRERAFKLGGLVVAIIALAPFLRMIASGQSLFFRDLSVFHFPLKKALSARGPGAGGVEGVEPLRS